MHTKHIKLVKEVVQHSQRHSSKEQKMPAIEFKNLVVDFGETVAVDNLSLKINQGELVTLLGPSGCGKTTTLNAIAGLLMPTSGKILFKGKDITKFSPQRRELGLVFQNYALYPHMTVYKNIAFPLRNDVKWQSNIQKENDINKLKAEIIILKSNGATEKELKDLFDNKMAIYDSIRETEFYLNKVSSLFYESYNTALARLDLVKPHYQGAKSKAYKKALKLLQKVEEEFKNAIKSAGKSEKAILKQKYNKKKHKIKTNLDFELELAKSNRDQEKLYAEKLIQKAKDEMDQSPYKKNLQVAKENVKKVPKIAKAHFIETRKQLIQKYSLKRNNLSETDKAKVESFEGNIISLKEAIHNSVMEVAEKLDITKNLGKHPTKLSGGQQQRVAIARGIVKRPDILLMDEPLSNLDAKLRIEARNWIRKIQQNLGITLIFVTHDQEEAMSISDTVICLNSGKVQQMGSPMELYSKPANEFVARFLGMPEMKIFETNADSNGNVKIGSMEIAKLSKEYYNEPIKVGVRSENIELSKTGLEAIIDSVELLGKDSLLHIEIKDLGRANVIIEGNSQLNSGDKIKVSFDKKSVHLFNKKGERI